MNYDYEPALEEWRVWVTQKEEKRMAIRLQQSKVWVEKLLDSAVGGAGMCNNIDKPRPWRGRAQVIEDVFQGAQPMKRVEVQRWRWREHWQVDTPEQIMDDKLWEIVGLQDLEEALPLMRTVYFLKGGKQFTRQALMASTPK